MGLRIVDSDAHVVESINTFSHIEPQDSKYTPLLLNQAWGPTRMSKDGNVGQSYWLIDGNVYARGFNVNHQETTEGQREMTDIAARLKHMDQMGVDVQVLYPSMFLAPWTTNPDWEYALYRSYNRWLAEIWKASENRLRWAALPPLRSMHKVRDELTFAKDNGACAVMLVGLECEKQMHDPYFFPLWEIASDLDLAVCFHSGNHSFKYLEVYAGEPTGFGRFRAPALGAFHVLVMKDIPKMFPKIRWGFVEVSASWIPYVMNHLELSFKKNRSDHKWSARDLMKQNKMYVACQVTDDLSYVLQFAGEDNLVIGTDYGHHDQATEIEAMRKIRDEGKIAPGVIDKILDANARALYGLN